MSSAEPTARRYVRWLQRKLVAICAGSLALFAVAILLIVFRLPIRADFSYLLPQDAPAVRDLRKLEARMVEKDTALVLVSARDAETREAASERVAKALRAISKDLVESVEVDDAELREFLFAHRYLFVPVADLVRARDALVRRIERAKLRANPLFVELEEDGPGAAERDRKQLDDLRARGKAAEARLARSGFISEDGRIVLIRVNTAFQARDIARGERLVAEIAAIAARVAAPHSGVEVGAAGGVPTTVAEHRALARGILWSSLITAALVAILMVIYLRRLGLLVLLTVNVVACTTIAFGAAALTVGHLNAATAFLGAIIAGNGVNYGILLVARYLEERERHLAPEAMAAAIAATLRPTIIASLGAAIAYGSLAVTSFRGFSDFAAIGAVGMLVCWIGSYVLLPALVLKFAGRADVSRGDRLGNVLARIFGFRRPLMVCLAAGALAAGAGTIVWRYLANDPLEYNLRNLRSVADDALVVRKWQTTTNEAFGRGVGGKTYVAADRQDQVAGIVTALRAIDAELPVAARRIGGVSSILDVLPPDQVERLRLLGEIREIFGGVDVRAMGRDAYAELLELRPPDDLRPLTVADLPRALTDKLTERDGRLGLLVAVQIADHLDPWNGRDLMAFASAIRELHLPTGETVTSSGMGVIFADIVTSIARDGVLVTVVASLGLVLLVVLGVGFNRRAVAVLAATGLGTLAMIAVCALLGLKVNFLDFIALPITLGLGVDYAINIAERAREGRGVRETLRTSGGAVLICSLTTIIGYGSLQVSDNLAIRGFGLASLIGEITCVLAALALVPAIMVLGQRPPLDVTPR
ncbi:MAG: MMPL family transporter [Deltaproteobacteria bacterium]|nr:MMPL family transporter [Deltaproteobacteria bacterium]